MYKFFFIVLAFNMLTTTLLAQVTIGSAIPPVEGTLLQLQEFPSDTPGGANATRGLLLPRVLLKKIDTLEGIEGAVAADNASYAGLMVYNLGSDLCENMFPGVFIWNGAKWQNVNNSLGVKSEILEDKRDPAKVETYRVGKFVNSDTNKETVVWMLENLRATQYDDADKTSLKFATDAQQHDELPFYSYPGYDASRFAKEGYFYSGTAALRPEAGQVISDFPSINAPADAPSRNAQGICPQGWRIPTYEDWQNLFEVIQGNPCDYAHPLPTSGNHLGALVRPGNEDTNYTSREPIYRGFHAFPTGAYYWLGTQEETLKKHVAFATTYPSPYEIGGVTYKIYSPIYFVANGDESQLFSTANTSVPVRCVKGDLPSPSF